LAERHKAAIEPDSEMATGLLDRVAEGAALILGKSHRLFDEDVLACAQRIQGLLAVMTIARDQDYGIHIRVGKNLVVIGAAILAAKANRVTLRAGGVCGADC